MMHALGNSVKIMYELEQIWQSSCVYMYTIEKFSKTCAQIRKCVIELESLNESRDLCT